MPVKGKKPQRGAAERRARFVQEYLVDLNGARAAIRAGYAPKHSRVIASKMLRDQKISAEIEKAKAEREVRTGITQDRVLRELEALAFSDVTHYVTDDSTGQLSLAEGAPSNAMRAIASVKRKVTHYDSDDGKDNRTTVEVEYRLWNKPETLKIAGRHCSTPGFYDKIQVSADDNPSMSALLVLAHQEIKKQDEAQSQTPAAPAKEA